MTLTFQFNGELVEFHEDAFYVPPVYIAISDEETEQLLK
jgi:hypothetical protein